MDILSFLKYKSENVLGLGFFKRTDDEKLILRILQIIKNLKKSLNLKKKLHCTTSVAECYSISLSKEKLKSLGNEKLEDYFYKKIKKIK